ncbi:MAG: hypothetical protein QF842_03005 [Candidatus Marinimicrobia bacterium]|jgi:hypothetical protein|nr:hypothetical protein [Candidatus Neomarinimicrobiota bacterium]MDP6611154.1 hypothetical protein [Candidatus Neomarinimicrobiota bacterium]|tara:strand:+ start:10566 stop:11051 length:486 start_codon:yes stop_codon:yes gene_type:complete
MNSIQSFPKELKILIAVFIIVLTIGVTIGLIYVGYNTDYSVKGTQTYYTGDPVSSDFDIPEMYPKSIEALLLTTHTHIIAFAIIFLVVGALMFFTNSLPSKWKFFLMIEPLISTLVTFGSFFAIRFVHSSFVYVIMVSGILMYVSFYFMSYIIFKESISPH